MAIFWATRPRAHVVSGQVAQLVEQRTENPRVGGSIPSLAISPSSFRRNTSLILAAKTETGERPDCANSVSELAGKGPSSGPVRGWRGTRRASRPLRRGRAGTRSRTGGKYFPSCGRRASSQPNARRRPRSRFRTAVRRKSWGIRPTKRARLQALIQARRNTRIGCPSRWRTHGMMRPSSRSSRDVSSRWFLSRSANSGKTPTGNSRPSRFSVVPGSRRTALDMPRKVLHTDERHLKFTGDPPEGS
jgi:hypothetical protein